MASATRKRKTIEFPVTRFVAIIALGMALFLIIDFGQRVASGYQVAREEEKLEAQLRMLSETNAALLARRDYVNTDAYVEEIARKELKWSKPGETVVVILATPQAPSPVLPAGTGPAQAHAPESPLDAWTRLFFSTD